MPGPDTGRAADRGGRDTASASAFHVPALLDFVGSSVQRCRRFFLWLGRIESDQLVNQLRNIPVTKPIYVCGLARSGSTLLHEIIASCPGVATHRLRDYPMVYTPYWWRKATRRLRPRPAHERPHRDRIMITADSPDALEEMLWMPFFPASHDSTVANVIPASFQDQAFADFYRTHVRKLILAENATRYVAKANYHVARLAFLVRLFPDAKFIIPVRAPVSHVASLLRQHRLFSDGQRGNPRALAIMQRSGHFEFGLDRRPLNLGDSERVRRILEAWGRGDEVRGWAGYWSMVHEYLADLLESDAHVRAQARIVRFEEMCAKPGETIHGLLDFCELPDAADIAERFAATVSAPTYYRADFSPVELAALAEETRIAAQRWGY